MSCDEDNKQKSTQLLPIVKGLLVLAAIIFIAVCGVAALISLAGPGVAAFFSSLTTLDSAIVVALITAMVSVLTFVLGGIANNVMKRNEYLRASRRALYATHFDVLRFPVPRKKGKDFYQ